LDDRADWAPYEIVSLAVDKSDASKLIAVALRTAGSENIGQGRRCHFQIQSGGARRQLLAKAVAAGEKFPQQTSGPRCFERWQRGVVW
jgi:hypothetical protein